MGGVQQTLKPEFVARSISWLVVGTGDSARGEVVVIGVGVLLYLRDARRGRGHSIEPMLQLAQEHGVVVLAE